MSSPGALLLPFFSRVWSHHCVFGFDSTVGVVAVMVRVSATLFHWAVGVIVECLPATPFHWVVGVVVERFPATLFQWGLESSIYGARNFPRRLKKDGRRIISKDGRIITGKRGKCHKKTRVRSTKDSVR